MSVLHTKNHSLALFYVVTVGHLGLSAVAVLSTTTVGVIKHH